MTSQISIQPETDRPGVSRQSCKVRDALFSMMRELGINKIFGNVGSTEEQMLQDFPSDFEYILAFNFHCPKTSSRDYQLGKMSFNLSQMPWSQQSTPFCLSEALST
jgi:hypothetical protein